MTSLIFIVAIILAYCLGSVSFAIIVSKMMGLQDPRTFGSHNPGATNVLRTGKKIAAALTLLGDGAKGWLAVWLAFLFIEHQTWPAGLASLFVFTITIAVLVGHMWPIFFRFQGGKGVATALGMLLAFNPWLGISSFAIWLVLAVLFRLSSVAALAAAISAPLLALYWLDDTTHIAALFIVALLVIRRHKSNIIDLLSGTESKIGEKEP
jgi:glycerol-3-phosphate acyltransferase PlsY